MKKRLSMLLILSATATCWGMEEKQEENTAVKKILLNPDKTYMALVSKDCYKIYNIETGKKVFAKSKKDLFHFNFIADDKLLYVPAEDKESYIIRDLNTEKETTVTLKTRIETVRLSPNTHYMVVNSCDNNMVDDEATMHNLVNQKNIEPLGYLYADRFSFSPNSKLFAFYGPRMGWMYLYDLEKGGRVGLLQEDTSGTKQVLFLNDSMVIFSRDYQTYYIWNLENNGLKKINLEGFNYARYAHKLNKKYFYGNVWEQNQCVIYDFSSKSWYNKFTEKLHWLPESIEDAYTIDCVINKDGTHLVLTNNKKSARVISTKDWEVLNTITFPQGHLNPAASFSRCGKFIALTCHGTSKKYDQLKVYDIENNTIIFESSWTPGLNDTEMQFLKKDMLLFASDTNEITIYNYKANKKHALWFDENISYFICAKKILLVALESKTAVVPLENIEFEEYIPMSVENNTDEKEEIKEGDDATDTDERQSVSFYDHHGNLVTQKLQPKKTTTHNNTKGSCAIL